MPTAGDDARCAGLDLVADEAPVPEEDVAEGSEGGGGEKLEKLGRGKGVVEGGRIVLRIVNVDMGAGSRGGAVELVERLLYLRDDVVLPLAREQRYESRGGGINGLELEFYGIDGAGSAIDVVSDCCELTSEDGNGSQQAVLEVGRAVRRLSVR